MSFEVSGRCVSITLEELEQFFLNNRSDIINNLERSKFESYSLLEQYNKHLTLLFKRGEESVIFFYDAFLFSRQIRDHIKDGYGRYLLSPYSPYHKTTHQMFYYNFIDKMSDSDFLYLKYKSYFLNMSYRSIHYRSKVLTRMHRPKLLLPRPTHD